MGWHKFNDFKEAETISFEERTSTVIFKKRNLISLRKVSMSLKYFIFPKPLRTYDIY